MSNIIAFLFAGKNFLLSDRLLKKRQKQEENMFKKSVSFIGENERTKLDRPQSATSLRPHRGVTGKLIQPILVFSAYHH
jgi:hypothetical protein